MCARARARALLRNYHTEPIRITIEAGIARVIFIYYIALLKNNAANSMACDILLTVDSVSFSSYITTDTILSVSVAGVGIKHYYTVISLFETCCQVHVKHSQSSRGHRIVSLMTK